MSSTQLIRSLFASDIDRTIEEVIKVDERDEDHLCDEIAEYVVTDSLRSHFTRILEKYAETPQPTARGDRYLGVRLLWCGKVQLRKAARSRYREPHARGSIRIRTFR